jgi:hypothetical protein
MPRKKLTNSQRNLALRRIGEGYSRKEVATSMGVTPRAITGAGGNAAERKRKSRATKQWLKKTTPPASGRRK